MKKSLLLSSLIGLALIYGCGQEMDSKPVSVINDSAAPKSKADSSAVKIDTLVDTTIVAEATPTNSPNAVPQKERVINHTAEDQDIIDSLKAAKTRLKK